jgi:malonyl CoA-acyl carrier protein transacylase
MSWKALSCAVAACAGVALASTAVVAATAQQERAQKTAQIPRCGASLGTIAVEQPQRNWWSELQLGSPKRC